ncbi:lytic polysaccharide monooxygenase [Streptomyces pathocidini]|uniref:lytic polysaccharide monooxygenase n=1 Tax=Streptomyces pathocidini TaxID=1650571 RepID=UPI00340EBDD3
MNRKRTTIAALGAAAVGLSIVSVSPAWGDNAPGVKHGAGGSPASRVVACKLLGVTNYPGGVSSNQACNAAFAEGGEAVFNNWNEVRVPDTRPNYQQGAPDAPANKAPKWRQTMPDGKLCSAGDSNDQRAKGLNLARTDWPTTDLPKGGSAFTFSYAHAAVHNPYTFYYFVTKDGYDPSKPLTWNDLEDTPFLVAHNQKPNGEQDLFDEKRKTTNLAAQLPNKSGKHLIFTIWQGNVKTDGAVQSNEAFISCADVNFK